MKKHILFFVIGFNILFFGIFSCKDNIKYRLQIHSAWLNHDKKYCERKLKSISQKDNNTFFYDIVDFQMSFGFKYGEVDFEKMLKLSKNEQDIVKFNIICVYYVYLNSSLFYETDLEKLKTINDFFGQDFSSFWNQKYNIHELTVIKNKMNNYKTEILGLNK